MKKEMRKMIGNNITTNENLVIALFSFSSLLAFLIFRLIFGAVLIPEFYFALATICNLILWKVRK